MTEVWRRGWQRACQTQDKACTQVWRLGAGWGAWTLADMPHLVHVCMLSCFSCIQLFATLWKLNTNGKVWGVPKAWTCHFPSCSCLFIHSFTYSVIWQILIAFTLGSGYVGYINGSFQATLPPSLYSFPLLSLSPSFLSHMPTHTHPHLHTLSNFFLLA